MYDLGLVMPSELLRERVLDAACHMLGRLGRPLGVQMSQPFVIVGTGRCGTNLLVDILRSHRGISGFPGEANELWHPLLEPFESAQLAVPPIEVDPARFSEISVNSWPANQGAKIHDIFVGFHLVTGASRVFFTKSAMISFLMPKILQIFPGAKFIHIYRYGPSVVESYFKKNFGKYSRYHYTAKDYKVYCARYWNACILEIEKRKTDLSLEHDGKFLEFSYESLCQDPSAKIEALAKFLGVPPGGFRFDLGKISSQNFKASDYSKDLESNELLKEMYPGMKLKGYLS
jgi:hypothetical protein